MERKKEAAAEKVHWDVKYLQEYGFRTDVKILLETVLKVLRREDVVEGRTEDVR